MCFLKSYSPAIYIDECAGYCNFDSYFEFVNDISQIYRLEVITNNSSPGNG